MISDNQVRRLRELMAKDDRVAVNAAKVGMDTKTARKYLRDDGLPSELAASHTWRTREDPFAEVWAEVHPFLELNAGLEAKTLFEYLQRANPGRFPDGQLLHNPPEKSQRSVNKKPPFRAKRASF